MAVGLDLAKRRHGEPFSGPGSVWKWRHARRLRTPSRHCRRSCRRCGSPRCAAAAARPRTSAGARRSRHIYLRRRVFPQGTDVRLAVGAVGRRILILRDQKDQHLPGQHISVRVPLDRHRLPDEVIHEVPSDQRPCHCCCEVSWNRSSSRCSSRSRVCWLQLERDWDGRDARPLSRR